jgi:hypothetical protein
MNDDNELLDQRLRDAYRVEPSAALKDRLLEIPNQVSQPLPEKTKDWGLTDRVATWLASFDWRLAAPAMAVIAAIGIIWAAGLQTSPTESLALEQEAIARREAIRDFIVVMEYLNDSTARANAAVQGELGAGLMLAFERGEQSFRDTSNRVTNGG